MEVQHGVYVHLGFKPAWMIIKVFHLLKVMDLTIREPHIMKLTKLCFQMEHGAELQQMETTYKIFIVMDLS